MTIYIRNIIQNIQISKKNSHMYLIWQPVSMARKRRALVKCRRTGPPFLNQ